METTMTHPDDETFVAEGTITSWTPGGGGYAHSPGYVNIEIDNKKLTLRSSSGPRNCLACSLSDRNYGGSYGKGYYVLVTQIHGHYIIRPRK